jgi:hypothetical protein
MFDVIWFHSIFMFILIANTYLAQWYTRASLSGLCSASIRLAKLSMELNMPQSLATCHLRRAVALGDIDAMLMLADLELKNGIPHIFKHTHVYTSSLCFFHTYDMVKH